MCDLVTTALVACEAAGAAVDQLGYALLLSWWPLVHTFAVTPACLADQRKQDLQLLEAAPPDEGGGGASRSLMPYAKDADDIDADADDDDSSSDEVGGCVVGEGL